MIPLSAIGAGLSGLKTLLKGAVGVGQFVKGNRMKVDRPIYDISQESKDELSQAELNLNAKLPGQSIIKDQILQGESRFVDNIREGATDTGTLLQAAGGAVRSSNDMFKNLSLQFENAFQTRLGALNMARRNMTAQKDKAFEINEMGKFIEDSRTKSALTEAGIQNTIGAVGEAGGMIGKYQFFKDLGGSMGEGSNIDASKRAELFAKYEELQKQGFGKVLSTLGF